MQNGTGKDAAVKLVQEHTPRGKKRAVYVRYIYVCAGEILTIREIPSGRYVLMFALGEDWDGERFRRDRHAFQFAEPFDFQEIRQDRGVTYSTFEVTLHSVPEGKASVNAISLDLFEASDTEESTIRLKSL